MEPRTPTKDLPNGYERVPAVTINIFVDGGGISIAPTTPVGKPPADHGPAIRDFLNEEPNEPEDDVDEIILRERFYALDIEAKHIAWAFRDTTGRFTLNDIWTKLREYWDAENYWSPDAWAAGIKRSSSGENLEPRFSSSESGDRPAPKAISPGGLRERLRTAINDAAIVDDDVPFDVYQEQRRQGRETIYVFESLGDEEE